MNVVPVEMRPAGSPDHLRALETWRTDIQAVLQRSTIPSPAWIATKGPLGSPIAAMNAWMDAIPAVWAHQWHALAPARDVARLFDGKCVLLVFGKFNAGKSSLCNYLARCSMAEGHDTRWFQIIDGAIHPNTSTFAEGATETTTSLQGVDLGTGVVLLDTPGLHSTSEANEALTRLFTDCADGVLWLTSSSAPGQVQELDELAQEIQRRKPLLPVITRSDFYEEDEVDGALVSILCNKSEQDRALQEADVSARSMEKLQAIAGTSVDLRPPLSISVAVAVNAGNTRVAREAAGIARLQAALALLLDDARAYHGRKQEEILLHYLQEHVLAALQAHWRPRLDALTGAVEELLAALPETFEQARDTAWRSVVLGLPDMLERYLVHGERDTTLHLLGEQTVTAVASSLGQHLPALDLQIEHVAVPPVSPALDAQAITANAYQRNYASLEQYTGATIDALLAQARERALVGLRVLLDHLHETRMRYLHLGEELQELARALRR